MRSLVFIILAFATLVVPLARCAEVTVRVYAHHLTAENAARYEMLNDVARRVGATSEYAQLKFGPGAYGDGAAFAVGERVRCVAVSTEKSGAARTSEVQEILQTMPLELDATGKVTATGCLAGATIVDVPYYGSGVAAERSVTATEGYIGAGMAAFVDAGVDNLLKVQMGDAYVAEKSTPYDYWNANVLADEKFDGKNFYLFVIIEDTRSGTGSPGAGTVAYGVALIMKDIYELAHTTRDWSTFNYSACVLSAGSLLMSTIYDFCFLSPVVMKELALPETLVVGGETYSGEDVEKVLSPALGAWTLTEAGWALTLATTEAGDVESQIPGVAVPDYLRYTVMTKANLSEDWVPLDKALDNASGNVYTRCRLVDLGSLVLPTVNGDTSRFYKIEQAK